MARIRDRFGEDAIPNAPMSERTNFRVGGPADLLVIPRKVKRLQELHRLLKGTGIPVFVLSGGSNLIVRDGGIRGLVIDMSQGFDSLSFSEEANGEVRIVAGAGLAVSLLVEACAEGGWTGMEWAAGIPGSLGGGVRGNAGTRDGDFAGVIRSIQLVDEDGEFQDQPRGELEFRYRGLVREGRFVLVSAHLTLRRGEPEEIQKKIRELMEWRYARQPYESASAGSIFKNPEEAPAGRLIDQAGLKGLRVGGAAISPVHTNFIVNTGGATAAEIIELIEKTRSAVKDFHGVELLTEVIIVGEANAKD